MCLGEFLTFFLAWTHVKHVSAQTRTCQVTRLTPDSKYWFRVCAENEVGKGSFLGTMTSVEAKSPNSESINLLICKECLCIF